MQFQELALEIIQIKEHLKIVLLALRSGRLPGAEEAVPHKGALDNKPGDSQQCPWWSQSDTSSDGSEADSFVRIMEEDLDWGNSDEGENPSVARNLKDTVNIPRE